MKLAEALMTRKDIVKQINKIKEEITSNLVSRVDFALPFDMINLFEKFHDLQNTLEDLNIEIDKANAQNLLPQLNKIRILDAKIAFLNDCRKKLLSTETGAFYTREEVKYTRNVDINDLNKALGDLETQRRTTDKEIQKINWQADIFVPTTEQSG